MERIILFVSVALLSCHRQPAPANSTPVRSLGSQAEAVTLLPQWDQSKTSNTYFIRYRLANQSESTIYPTRDNFSGVVEQWDGDRWDYVVGGVSGCLSGMQWIPLTPGREVESQLLSSPPIILHKGRYRYRVEYSKVPHESPDHAILSVSSEFEIESSNRRTQTTGQTENVESDLP